jgi:hypothetical protein
MLAEELIDTITIRYQNRSIEIEVSEDGENGAILKLEEV